RVTALVRGYLWIDSMFMAQTRLRSPQYLEIHPMQAHCGQFLLDVPPQEIVAGQECAAFGRKYQSVVADVHAECAPRIDILRKFGWNRSSSPASVVLWIP